MDTSNKKNQQPVVERLTVEQIVNGMNEENPSKKIQTEYQIRINELESLLGARLTNVQKLIDKAKGKEIPNNELQRGGNC